MRVRLEEWQPQQAHTRYSMSAPASVPVATASPGEHGLQAFVQHVETLKVVGEDGNSGFAREFSMLRARMLA